MRYLRHILVGILLVSASEASVASNAFSTNPETDLATVMKAPLKKQPTPLRFAQATQTEAQRELALWNSVKDSRDPNVLRTYINAYPNGAFSSLARVFINNLSFASKRPTPKLTTPIDAEPKSKTSYDFDEKGDLRPLLTITAYPPEKPIPEPEPEVAPTPPPLVKLSVRERTINLQTELVRLGCNPGRVDGQWGGRGRRALARFKRFARVQLPYADLSSEVFDAVKVEKDGLCPPRVRIIKRRRPVRARRTVRVDRRRHRERERARIYRDRAPVVRRSRPRRKNKGWSDCVIASMDSYSTERAGSCN